MKMYSCACEIALRSAWLNSNFPSGAKLIGVNNRDLKTFETDLKRSYDLFDKIPADIVKISESGLKDPEDAQALKAIGFDAVLVGEALVKSNNPQTWIQRAKL